MKNIYMISKNIYKKYKYYLAPLSQYTNRPFREIVKKYALENEKKVFTFVPLVNVSQIKYKGNIDFLDIEKEKHVGLQLFGLKNDFATAIDILNSYNLKWIDLNAGCPMQNITKIGSGASLLDKPKDINFILKQMSKSNVKVKSIKIRLSQNNKEILKIAEKYVDVIIVHGRTKKQVYSGKADWQKIKWFKDNTNLFVIGNGDITSLNQGETYIKNNYADAFMIGREAMKNPFIFANKQHNPKKAFLEYYKLYIKYSKDTKPNLIDLKQKALQFLHGFEKAKKLRLEASNAKTIEEIIKIFEQI